MGNLKRQIQLPLDSGNTLRETQGRCRQGNVYVCSPQATLSIFSVFID